MSVKQVIVMRKKFPVGPNGEMQKIRQGKMIAQGAHASIAVILNAMKEHEISYEGVIDHEIFGILDMSSDWEAWIKGMFTKVCLGVDTEEELLELYEKAKEAKLPCVLITDSGLTEFKGVPTNTCIAIGPAQAEMIDEITGTLSLL